MSATAFRYDSALHQSSNAETIRLLDLHPGEYNSPVSCQLRTVSLSSRPVYLAISYCWGSQTRSDTITCNEQPLRITNNLHRALQQFRDPSKSITVWADAVCINQQDVSEKNHQVPLMGKIFGQARQVRVWLDPGDHHQGTKEAGERILELVSQAHHYLEKLSIPPGDLFNSMSSVHWSQAQYDAAEKQKPYEKWEPLFHLLLNPWFTRIWIVQEVSLASDRVQLYYGETTIQWNDIVTAMHFSMHTDWFTRAMDIKGDEQILEAWGRVCRLVRTTVAVRDTEEEADIGILWLLLMHRATMSTDPRDKVYALLSIARKDGVRGSSGLLITPDYHLSAATLYQLITEKFLARFPSLGVLTLTGHKTEQGDSRVEKLPSWVVDWSDRVSMAATLTQTIDRVLEASPKPGEPSPCHLGKHGKWYKVEGKILKVRGYLLDEITEAGDIVVASKNRYGSLGPAREQERRGLIYQLFSDLAELWGYSSQEDIYTPTGELLLDVMLRQICVNDMSKWVASFERHPRELLKSWIKIGREVKLWTEAKPPVSGEQLEKALHEIIENNPSPLPFDETVKTMRMCMTGLGISVPYRSRRGYFGLSMSRTTRTGDRIALIQGATMPLMLRRVQDGDDCWTMNGEVIVQGIMRGQAFDIEKCGELRIV